MEFLAEVDVLTLPQPPECVCHVRMELQSWKISYSVNLLIEDIAIGTSLFLDVTKLTF